MKRIEQLERLVGFLLDAVKNHSHEFTMTGESSCGCCPGPSTTYYTETATGLPELPD